jgi:hypothetical protein
MKAKKKQKSGMCTGNESPPAPEVVEEETCKDANPNCRATINGDGVLNSCSNVEEIAQTCRSTCKLCSEPEAPVVGGCGGTQFGCCPDSEQSKSDAGGTDCAAIEEAPVVGGCGGTQFGCCPDSEQSKSDAGGTDCAVVTMTKQCTYVEGIDWKGGDIKKFRVGGNLKHGARFIIFSW